MTLSVGRFVRGSITCGLIILSGCVSTPGIELPKSTQVRSTDEAASVLVSPTMVAPWADVSTTLKPAFTMNGDTAAAQVLPTTEQIQSQVLNAFGFSLGIGLPGSSTSSSNGNTLNSAFGSNTAGGLTSDTASSSGTTTSTTTTTTAPGIAPSVPSGIPAGASLPAVAAQTGPLGLDPVLRYKAANYLNQEVQLLNQEIDNAASRQCFVPYVVKLKIAVMTYQPSLGYSIHTRASFFHGEDGTAPPSKAEVAAYAAQLLTAVHAADLKAGKQPTDVEFENAQVDLTTAMKTVEEAHIAPACLVSSHVPVVVPLLVADDMEVALKSRAAEAAQQIGLALNFMLHGVGANAAANNVRQSLTAISSQQFSSALTVSRDNDNTLYIHIEPTNQASGDPNLVGQTYDVAVLLLVPRTYFEWDGAGPSPAQMSLITYTQFRDAKSGKLLASRPEANEVAALDRVILPYLDDKGLKLWRTRTDAQKIDAESHLADAITEGNFTNFQQYFDGGTACTVPTESIKKEAATAAALVQADLNDPSKTADQTAKTLKDIDDFRQFYTKRLQYLPELCFGPGSAPALWSGLSSVISERQYKTASFQAPVPAPVSIPVQTVLASDDKSHPIQVAIAGVSGASTATLSAHFYVMAEHRLGTAPAIPSALIVPPQSLALDTTAHTLTLTFPSLGKTGLSPPDTSKPAKAGDDSFTLDPTNAGNAVVIDQVGCEPTKRLCPVLSFTPGATASSSVTLPVRFVMAPKAPPSPAVTLASAGGNLVIAQGGGGILSVWLANFPKNDAVALSVSGAQVTSATGLNFAKPGYTATKIGGYALALGNLKPGDTITLTAQAYNLGLTATDGDPATATYTAVADVPVRR